MTWMGLLALNPSMSWASGLSEKYIVLVELKGANDGINTLVPFGADEYVRLRPNLALSPDEVITLGESPVVGPVGLNSALSSLDAAIGNDLAIIQGLGYPNQNRSHFKSIAIWETGGDGNNSRTTGWLTESLEHLFSADDVIAHGASLEGLLGLFARGEGVYLSMTRLNQISGSHAPAVETSKNLLMQKIIKKKVNLKHTSSLLEKKLSGFPASYLPVRMPNGKFSAQLTDTLRVIGANAALPVMHVQHGSFDTHQGQKWRHPKLLKELGDGLAKFRQNLIKIGRWNDVLVLTYSEFGRRVSENGAKGTDHGTASVHFAMGGKIRPGLYGRYPSLNKLEDGDLIHTMDYRALYERVCTSWLGHRKNKWRSFSDKELKLLFNS